MIVNFDGSVNDLQKAWFNDAIAHSTFPWDTLAETVNVETVAEPSLAGHKDIMCTTRSGGPGNPFVVEIRDGIEIANSPFNAWLPQGTDIHLFFMESVVHELGHVAMVICIEDQAKTAAASALFQKHSAGGGVVFGELADWTAGVWVDSTKEAGAETFKDVFMPANYRIFSNRTNWGIDPTSLNTYIAMFNADPGALAWGPWTVAEEKFFFKEVGVPGDGSNPTWDKFRWWKWPVVSFIAPHPEAVEVELRMRVFNDLSDDGKFWLRSKPTTPSAGYWIEAGVGWVHWDDVGGPGGTFSPLGSELELPAGAPARLHNQQVGTSRHFFLEDSHASGGTPTDTRGVRDDTREAVEAYVNGIGAGSFRADFSSLNGVWKDPGLFGHFDYILVEDHHPYVQWVFREKLIPPGRSLNEQNPYTPLLDGGPFTNAVMRLR